MAILAPTRAVGIAPRDSRAESHPDIQLLELCRHGNAGAFEILFRRYQTYVYNVCLGMMGNAEDAADITQETFLRLHRNLDSFRGDSSFGTWLYRVAVNLCLTELRKKQRSHLHFLEEIRRDEDCDGREEVGPSPEDAIEDEAERESVRQVLSSLPPDYRAVMVLRHYQQLAYEEIAEVLNLSLSQVKTRLFRARKLFKDRFLQAAAEDARAL